MDDLGRIDAHRRESAATGHRSEHSVFRVRSVEVIGHPPPEAIKFDAGANHVAVLGRRIEGDRQVLGFQHLNLQGHRQSILRPAIAQAHQRFAAFEHRPASQRLQSVEIRESRGIGVDRPVAPERLNGFANRRLRHHRLRFDAGTDGVGHVGFQG